MLPSLFSPSWHSIGRRLSRSLFSSSTSRLNLFSSCSTSLYLLPNLLPSPVSNATYNHSAKSLLFRTSLLGCPWSPIPRRGFKTDGSSLRVGSVIEKNDRIFEVLKVEHTHEGRGKATIKVELRDIDSGNKVTQRLGTDEAVKRVFVEAKTYIYMCTDRDGEVLLMDPETLDQLEVSEDFFGKKAKYLQDEMKVKIELYNGTPLSASVPKQVTCIVKEAQNAATPREKMALLQNGFTIKVPPHILAGDAIVIDTEDDSYIRRVKA